MALVVNTNMNALSIENTLSSTNNSVSASLQRLSSGLRINSAKDDPAGQAIGNAFKASIAAMQVATQNASQAQSMLQTADGAYTQINDIMVQMKSLATEAASGQQTANNLASLNGEFLKLQSEIDQIANSTTYNGTNILNGSSSSGGGSTYTGSAALQFAYNLAIGLDVNSVPDAGIAGVDLLLFAGGVDWGGLSNTEQNILSNMGTVANNVYLNGTSPGDSTQWANYVGQLTSIYNSYVVQGQTSSSSGYLVTFQVGATNTAANQIYVSFNNATTACLNIASSSVGIGSLASAQAAMTAIDSALTSINAFMGNVGAFQNQLQYTVSNLTTSIQNYTSSESTIMDVDMAAEVSTLTKSQILQQAGTAMLAQANSQPQQILKLLS
jgi:flagellin